MSTLKTAITALLVKGLSPADAALQCGAGKAYALAIRSRLVFEGKLPKGAGRGRPRKSK